MLVTFDHGMDIVIHEKVIALQQVIAASAFAGFIETVPAYASLAIFYDVVAIKNLHPDLPSVYEFVKQQTEQLIAGMEVTAVEHDHAIIRVPVYYQGDDLDELADQLGITVSALIQIHTERLYRVFMIGFQPGFAYMGILDERIAAPRKLTPRQSVPAGSVGIAGFQTGIYPFTSPGGWQLIGKTPVKIFDTEKINPCLFKAGDHIQFFSISRETFEKSNEY